MCMGSWLADGKNLIIAILAILVLVLGGLLLKGRVPKHAGGGKGKTTPPAVSVLDVAFDRENPRGLNIVFDRPLGEGHVGEVLGKDPAILKPTTGGVWKWQGANVLRFEATD